ncbi:MAG TPA: hypothetical protein VF778_01720 [Xanthobacteraceae bacterium]
MAQRPDVPSDWLTPDMPTAPRHKTPAPPTVSRKAWQRGARDEFWLNATPVERGLLQMFPQGANARPKNPTDALAMRTINPPVMAPQQRAIRGLARRRLQDYAEGWEKGAKGAPESAALTGEVLGTVADPTTWDIPFLRGLTWTHRVAEFIRSPWGRRVVYGALSQAVRQAMSATSEEGLPSLSAKLEKMGLGSIVGGVFHLPEHELSERLLGELEPHMERELKQMWRRGTRQSLIEGVQELTDRMSRVLSGRLRKIIDETPEKEVHRQGERSVEETKDRLRAPSSLTNSAFSPNLDQFAGAVMQ